MFYAKQLLDPALHLSFKLGAVDYQDHERPKGQLGDRQIEVSQFLYRRFPCKGTTEAELLPLQGGGDAAANRF